MLSQKASRHAAAALTIAFVLLVAACSSSSESSTTSTSSSTTTAASSDTMTEVQEHLKAVGCYDGPIDGEEGPETQAAIEEFQRAEGLEVDGKPGTETQASLKKAVAEGRTVCSAGTTSTTQGGAATTTTSGGGSECPGGPQCYDTSISPTSGGRGTVINVKITEGGCGDEANLVPPGGGPPINGTGQMQGAAGSLVGEITVPDNITASGTYTVETNAGPQDQCSKNFEATVS